MDKETYLEKKNRRLVLVTGGQRSGKSLFAEKMALASGQAPVYLATAIAADDEMRKRVEIHKKRREKQWVNIEEPLEPGEADIKAGSTVLLDCLTLLATNWFFKENEDIDNAFAMIRQQIDKLTGKDITLIAVTNEIGLGGVSENKMQRRFTDLQGMVNQYVADIADEVYLLISGIPLKIK